ncbi:hypothetical protein TrVFT333_003151 [Trichoderma virens FT-333]|nr:hypothetical protein TrVFT333_003151 [Trichoderma virens FT-333]
MPPARDSSESVQKHDADVKRSEEFQSMIDSQMGWIMELDQMVINSSIDDVHKKRISEIITILNGLQKKMVRLNGAFAKKQSVNSPLTSITLLTGTAE